MSFLIEISFDVFTNCFNLTIYGFAGTAAEEHGKHDDRCEEAAAHPVFAGEGIGGQHRHDQVDGGYAPEMGTRGQQVFGACFLEVPKGSWVQGAPGLSTERLAIVSM